MSVVRRRHSPQVRDRTEFAVLVLQDIELQTAALRRSIEKRRFATAHAEANGVVKLVEEMRTITHELAIKSV